MTFDTSLLFLSDTPESRDERAKVALDLRLLSDRDFENMVKDLRDRTLPEWSQRAIEWHEKEVAAKWITGRPFPAVVGKSYEVSFGQVVHLGQEGLWKATIRIDGVGNATWIDVDTELPLHRGLAKYVVQAYKEL